ncbi:MAG TPA: nodulation protein NfeD [Xanthobacteraceae bacterium]|nr:nodulation protein NfeD [Xanthobacteraceae bacterium]
MRAALSQLRADRTDFVLIRCATRALVLGILFLHALSAEPAVAAKAVVLQIDGAIGPAVADYIVRELRGISQADTRVVVLRMNTPGGLDTSMREIIRAILSSPVPVAAYVAPSGARAASAGTYITYASAIAAMAPGTNLGAATPIQLGGTPRLPGGAPQQKDKEKGSGGDTSASGPADTETRKAINDAVAYIRGLAELNGHNADWAAEAVRTAVSLPASEALKLNVIDVIADDVPDLLRKLDGRTVKVAGKPQTLATADLEIVTAAPDWRTELLAVITDPNVAFILLLIGTYGLIFEFLNPGAVAPGLIGAISLLVALYALNLLPINYAGAALVMLGIGLMVAEAHIGSFGVIGVGGIVAFVIGAIMMFPPGAPGFALSLSVVAGATAVTAALFLLVLTMLLRSRRRPVVTGKEGLLGAEGEVVAWNGEEGRVRVHGEIWRARAQRPLQPGARLKVINREGLVLVVEPA